MADQRADALTLGAARRKWSEGKDLFFNATRALLMVRSAGDAKKVITATVLALGGHVVPAVSAGLDALPLDLSFGMGEPVVAVVPQEGWARVLLERHLPALVKDARNALELCSQVERLAGEASIDALTGLADRRVLGRAFGRLDKGDTVIMIDVDRFDASRRPASRHRARQWAAAPRPGAFGNGPGRRHRRPLRGRPVRRGPAGRRRCRSLPRAAAPHWEAARARTVHLQRRHCPCPERALVGRCRGRQCHAQGQTAGAQLLAQGRRQGRPRGAHLVGRGRDRATSGRLRCP